MDSALPAADVGARMIKIQVVGRLLFVSAYGVASRWGMVTGGAVAPGLSRFRTEITVSALPPSERTKLEAQDRKLGVHYYHGPEVEWSQTSLVPVRLRAPQSGN